MKKIALTGSFMPARPGHPRGGPVGHTLPVKGKLLGEHQMAITAVVMHLFHKLEVAGSTLSSPSLCPFFLSTLCFLQ